MTKEELLKLVEDAALALQRPHGWLHSAEVNARERSLDCQASEEREALHDAKTAFQLANDVGQAIDALHKAQRFLEGL